MGEPRAHRRALAVAAALARVRARAAAIMPHTDIIDYRLASTVSETRGPFKATAQHGRVHVVACFPQGYNGRGCERFEDQRVYVGDYSGAKRHGRGTMNEPDGKLLLSFFKKDRAYGEGAKWATDYTTCVRTHNGKEDDQITLKEGAEIAMRIGLPCPTGQEGLDVTPQMPTPMPWAVPGWESEDDDMAA